MSTSISTIKNTDLATGMQVIIPAGDTVTIEGSVYPSRISAGQIVAETSIGILYFAGDLTSRVIVSDEAAPTGPESLAGAR